MIEYSYLFDEIPFALKPITDHWRNDLCGRYEVFYHDEKIDWGIGSDGWEVPSTRQNHREGMLLIGTSDTSSRVLEGYLLFIPNKDDEISDDEIIEEEEDDDDGGDEVIDEDDDDDDEESYSDRDGEEYAESEEDTTSDADVGDAAENNTDHDSSEESNDEQRSEHSESNSELLDGEESDSSNSHVALQERQDFTEFFHFKEDTFVLDDLEMYSNASWFDSGNEFGRFGLISYANPHRSEDDDRRSGDSSLTIYFVLMNRWRLQEEISRNLYHWTILAIMTLSVEQITTNLGILKQKTQIMMVIILVP